MFSEKKLEMLKRIANTTARKSKHKRMVAAVIIFGSKIISLGYNKTKTHPLVRKFSKQGTIHAEIDAILKVSNEEILKKCDIFVYRINKKGICKISKPCPLCTQVLHMYGIKKAYWTTSTMPYWNWDYVDNMFSKINSKEVFELNGKPPPPKKKKGI